MIRLRHALAALAAVCALAPAPVQAAQTRAFVLATDFATGTVSSVAFGPPPVATNNVAAVCADAVLRHHQGLLYVVERFGCDNVRVLDPANGFSIVRQFSVGNGSNPNDIAIASPTRAYVTRYERTELWVVNPSSGAFLGAISLAAFADADGIPEMSRLAVRNGRVFVTVQRVDRDLGFSPTDSSQVVVLDALTGAFVDCDPVAPGVQGIVLPFQNPTTEIVVDDAGRLVIGCTGAYGVADGGVVRIDPVALTVDAIETTEAALGGDIVDVAIGSSTRGFAVIGDASFNTICRPYDRASGVAAAPVFATAGFHIADAEVSEGGVLWLADRTPANPGVRLFNAVTLAPLTAGPVSTGLPPQDIEFDGSAPLAVGPGGADLGGTLHFAGAWPNPSRGEVALRFRMGPQSPGAPLLLSIFDALGRRIRTLSPVDAPPPGTELVLSWDGRDDRGRAAPPGVYGVRLDMGAGAAFGRLVRLPPGRL